MNKKQMDLLYTMNEKELQDLLRLKPLQEAVATLRTETPAIYEKNYYKICKNELKKHVNIKMDIIDQQLKIPSKEQLPALPKEQLQPKVDVLNVTKDCEDFTSALSLLS